MTPLHPTLPERVPAAVGASPQSDPVVAGHGAAMIRKTTHVLGAADDLVVDHYQVGSEIGRALVLPGFGRTADEYFLLSATLLHNQVSVVVPDFRFHPGRSAGDIMNFRLAQQAQDVASILDRFEVDVVFATSLSFPPSLRVLADRGWRGRLVGIVPVMAPGDTLLEVTGYDWHLLHDDHPRDQTLDIDGFEVNIELVADAVRDRMVEVASTVADARRFPGTVTMIVGDRDTWVDAAHTELVAAACTAGDRLVLREAAHDFGRSVRRARQVFHTAAAAFLSSRGVTDTGMVPLDVIIRSRQELRETGATTRLGFVA